jgi:N-acetylglucosaminyldiphosphoundecaprenol N-acetyl-beta-D-mannosaminyltransferase
MDRIRLFGIHIDRVTPSAAVDRVVGFATGPRRGEFVVTPNLDHIVLLKEHAALRAAYAAASLVVADGWPLVAASRLFDEAPLPERVAGSDLVPAVFERASSERPLSVYLLGAAPGVAEQARERIEQRWPACHVVGTRSPPLGFEHDPVENDTILQHIEAVGPDVLVVGLGAPKQELWVHTHRGRLAAGVAICAGATIDFLAGHKPRAPRWMGQVGVEWLHRLATEPQRLAPRYARNGVQLPVLLLQEWRRRRAASVGANS